MKHHFLLKPVALLSLLILMLSLLFTIQTGCGEEEENLAINQNAKEGTITITDWEYRPDRYLKLIDITGEWLFKRGDDLNYRLPDFDDQDWETIPVPLNWFSLPEGEKYVGFAWYRLHIKLPKEKPEDALAIELGWIDDVDATYLNGHLIGKTGEFPEGDSTINENHAYDRTRIYTIPIQFFNWGEDNDNVLAIRVNSMTYDTAGIYTGQQRIGSLNIIKNHFFNNAYIIVVFAALYIIVGLYHAFLYYKRPKTFENLFFAIFCLLIAITTMFRTQLKYFVVDDFLILKFSEYVIELLMVSAFIHFIIFEFEQKFINIASIIFDLLVIAYITLMIIYRTDVHTYFLIKDYMGFWVIIALTIFTLIYIIHFARQKNIHARIMLFGIIIFGLSFVLDIIFDLMDIIIPMIGQYGFFAFVISIAGALGNRFVMLFNEVERRQVVEENLRKTFQVYVPEKDLQRILADKTDGTAQLHLGGSREYQSIFFSDIRDFTSFSETLTPDEVVKFLNSYFSRMNEVIFNNNGIIDKFIGDSIMARFDENGAFNASIAAIKTRETLVEYNRYRANLNYKPISIGIGIATGDVVLGNIGSKNRMQFTVIGDTVNLASRLESATKFYSVPIMVDEKTYEMVKDIKTRDGKNYFYFRELDTIRVKGKEISSRVFELLSPADYSKENS